MPSVIIYDNEATPAQVTNFLVSVDPTPYIGREDVKIYDNITLPSETEVKDFISGKQLKYLKVSGENVVDYTQQEKDALDQAETAALVSSQKTDAKNQQTANDANARLKRAIVKLSVDQLNVLRKRDRDRAVDVAAATNLADLKTRWAARSTLDDIAYDQAKTAIENLVDGE